MTKRSLGIVQPSLEINPIYEPNADIRKHLEFMKYFDGSEASKFVFNISFTTKKKVQTKSPAYAPKKKKIPN